jgi:hypothetical protein
LYEPVWQNIAEPLTISAIASSLMRVFLSSMRTPNARMLSESTKGTAIWPFYFLFIPSIQCDEARELRNSKLCLYFADLVMIHWFREFKNESFWSCVSVCISFDCFFFLCFLKFDYGNNSNT